LKAIYDMIVEVTTDVIKKAGNLDEEDMANLLDEVQRIDKGKYFVMQISGLLLGNMGKTHTDVSTKVGDVLLPPFAAILLNLDEKQEYEITDAVCMLDDCLERGDKQLFEKIAVQAGAKLLEVIQHAGKDQSDIKYDILYSAIFGMGVIAQRSVCGMFAHLSETLAILSTTCKNTATDDMDEEEQDQRNNLRENSVSCLAKIILFQNDLSGSKINPQMTQEVFGTMLPLKHDLQEAEDLHSLIFEQMLAGNKVVQANADLFKQFVANVKQEAESNEEDILGDKGKALLQ
jgi:hypothetical protein